jgi:hypothetical protein
MRAFFVSDLVSERIPLLLARVRLVLAVAGVAWLFGYDPGLVGRLVAVLGVLVVLGLDYIASAAAAGRKTTGGAP